MGTFPPTDMHQDAARREELRAVATAYRAARGAGRPHHDSHLAARAALLELRPELDAGEAERRTVNLIAWAAKQHPDWLWKPLRDLLAGPPP